MIKSILLIVAIAMFTSCEDFLTQYPVSEISEQELPKDSSSVILLVNACYNGLQSAVKSEWVVTELRSDNARIHWALTSTSSYTYILETDIGQHSTINPFAEEYWNATYNNIYRCNYALEFINNIKHDFVQKGLNSSEVRAIRAYHYFNLVQNWGPVFLITKPILGNEARYTQRESVNVVYDFIISELEDIIEQDELPVRYNDNDLGRVNISFAKSLLAKVYMTHFQTHTTEYARAKLLLQEVIEEVGNPNDYSDLVPYDEIFSIDNEMNKEIIFAIRFKAGNVGLGSSFGNDFAPTNSGSNVIFGQGRSYNYPTKSLIDAYEPGDLRKDITLQEKYFDKDKGVWIEDAEINICRYVCKFLSPVTIRDDGENDFPVLRVGDIMLLYAEILNEFGEIEESLKYVNMIRQRAGLTAYTTEEIKNSTYELRKVVRNERRVELAFENHRWYDLMRWGVAVETINNHFNNTPFYDKLRGNVTPCIESWQTILPLPLSVLILNPELPQNYGY